MRVLGLKKLLNNLFEALSRLWTNSQSRKERDKVEQFEKKGCVILDAEKTQEHTHICLTTVSEKQEATASEKSGQNQEERQRLLDRFASKMAARDARRQAAEEAEKQEQAAAEEAQRRELERQQQEAQERQHRAEELQRARELAAERERLAKEAAEKFEQAAGQYQLPPLSLFRQSPPSSGIDAKEVEENSRKIQDCLDAFHIDATVNGAVRGPRVTMYKVFLAPGVLAQEIPALSQNLQMMLAARSLRILAPVPGQNYAGIEVPNRQSDLVCAGDMLLRYQGRTKKMVLPLCLGRTIEGDDVFIDLAKAPHLLVAGSTGTGKSVAMNSFIASMVAQFTPAELQMILVDPKMVEFNSFAKLPHLLVPVVTEIKLALLALRWLVTEMERRYRLFARAGNSIRNLELFNQRPPRPEGAPELLDEDNQPIPAQLPMIVLVLDELADLQAQLNKDEFREFETCLARLAQKSRAVGIHAIVATQRPSVNVLTGTIKTNFPTRLSFRVSSQIDSRTILDGKGAESLLGNGDCLYKSATDPEMIRVQGAFISGEEIENMVEYCAAQMPPRFSDYDLLKSEDKEAAKEKGNEDADVNQDISDGETTLIRSAAEILIRDRRASVSYLQRRLGIGYNHAADIMDQMEKLGIVGPALPGGRPREILVESLEEIFPNSEEP